MTAHPAADLRFAASKRVIDVAETVRTAVREQTVWDLHTHLYPPAFGSPTAGAGDEADTNGLCCWGIDELLTYHYLVAEVFRVVPASVLPYDDFWRMTRQEQADHVWKHLFVERSPISEACRGVLTTLAALGLDPEDRDLRAYRSWFADRSLDAHVDHVMDVAGVTRVTMTNDVFDDNERKRWLADPAVGSDPRFAGVLRFDALVLDWAASAKKLTAWGFPANADLGPDSVASARRFLGEWLDRVDAVYAAVSLPPDFRYAGADDSSLPSRVLTEVVLPVLEERGLAFAMMIGAVRGSNPSLRFAGDSLGPADVDSVMRLARDFPKNRFLATVLARESQHALAVAARKFGNVMVFGCWWFVNNPSLIEEITRMRVELLGLSFIPQHSDCRVLEQLVYKWRHSREVIARVLIDKYGDLAETGWSPTEAEIERDVARLLSGNFAEFVGRAQTTANDSAG